MTRFHEQDLAGAHFEHVSLRDAHMNAVDLTGAQIRGCSFSGARMRGVELVDVEISGELQNVVVNGVDIAPLVEAELNRRMPERAKMRPDDSDGFREAWAIPGGAVEGHGGACDDVARGSASPQRRRRVVFHPTLRHLNFASAAWVDRMVRGTASPWHPLDLPWDEAPGWDGIPWDRKARPSLDEVLTVRRERQAIVRHVLESLTDEQLAADVTRIEPGWPQMENLPIKECLRIVLNEEWQHRLYADRDLGKLEAPS